MMNTSPLLAPRDGELVRYFCMNGGCSFGTKTEAGGTMNERIGPMAHSLATTRHFLDGCINTPSGLRAFFQSTHSHFSHSLLSSDTFSYLTLSTPQPSVQFVRFSYRRINSSTPLVTKVCCPSPSAARRIFHNPSLNLHSMFIWNFNP